MQKLSAKNLIAIFIVVFSLFLAPVVRAESPTIYFDEIRDYIATGDEFFVDLMLDTHGETVNTISGDLVFNDDLISIKRVETANSIISTWIQSPFVSGNSVTFAGIMPGGYQSVIDVSTGEKVQGNVLRIIFSALRAGSATLSFSDSHLYLNDSLGTESKLVALPFTVSILNEKGGKRIPLTDTNPPEHFIPIIATSSEIYDGAYALYFSTTDKGSGIDHYEVSENAGSWVRADSPYKLTDQSIRGEVRVKAVDLAGNYVIEKASNNIPFNERLVLIPLLLFILALVLIYLFYHRKMKKYEKNR